MKNSGAHQSANSEVIEIDGIGDDFFEEDVEASPIFCEMLVLQYDRARGRWQWREKARWVKYEETVGISGERWSKPHVPLLDYESMLNLKLLLMSGVFLSHCEPETFAGLVDQMMIGLMDQGIAEKDKAEQLKQLFLAPKHHVKNGRLNLRRLKPFKKKKDCSDFVDDLSHVDASDTVMLKKGTKNKALTRKLQENASVAVILVGKSDLVSRGVCIFARLKDSQSIPFLSEVDRPIRYVCALLGPNSSPLHLDAVGRCLASMLTDDQFEKSLRAACVKTELAEVADSFVQHSRLVPPNKIGRNVRLDVNSIQATAHTEVAREMPIVEDSVEFNLDGLKYTGRIFGGLFDDVKRAVKRYKSDFTDAFQSASAFSQLIAAVMFIFLTNLANIIIFGAVMSTSLNQTMGIVESIISGCVSGIIFSLLSGQPLNILSATGPVLIFETIFYRACESYGVDFLAARGWLCLWTAVNILLLVAVDASCLVAFITRFTEELFATLISIIFIIESLQGMAAIYSKNPIVTNYNEVIALSQCWHFANETNSSMVTTEGPSTAKEDPTALADGTLERSQCNFHPDVFLFSVTLFFTAFTVMHSLKKFRNSIFFPDKVRETLSNFAAFISIVITTIMSELVPLDVPKLVLPETIRPTVDRSWLVDWFSIKYWWIGIATCLPALLLTILLVMDQQITAVIINRPENLLKKGFGYHLDLLAVAVTVIVCGILGLPIFVAATMLSISHVQSLRIESSCKAPGEKPVFTGIREQRLSALLGYMLIGLSLLFTAVHRMIPMPALLGVFLNMGISCMFELQLFQRIILVLSPQKHQPEYRFLPAVPIRRVHKFTAIQVAAFLVLCAVKYTKSLSLFFPLMLVVMVFIRKFLDRVFSQHDLHALDDLLPTLSHLKMRTVPNQKAVYSDTTVRL